MYKIGIDVGGTNTDAVLLHHDRLIASCKTATTADVEQGVCHAIGEVLARAAVPVEAVAGLMIGTTQFTNAFIERRHLSRIGVIRIGAPATTAVPPLYDWPEDLIAAVGRDVAIVGGGYEFDGNEIAALDERAIAETARAFRRKGIAAVAISCCFAPVNATMEMRAAEIVRGEIPDARISCSSAFGRIGLIDRENAAAMNASLATLAEKVVGSFRNAIRRIGIVCPFHISQNDGTLMNADDVEARPVLTFASGPTNSMRGAAFLSGVEDAIIVDIGGTTTDVGCLLGGFPRESAVAVDIGGVRTNFRMPDLISVGIGGGSIVQSGIGGKRVDEEGEASLVGPRSVGFELATKALVFGGDVLTATDIAVAAGTADIGDPSKVGHLTPAVIEAALADIHRQAETAIDRMRTNSRDTPVILVGGGSILISRPLHGTPDVRRPDNYDVANAVGAAIAEVSGEVDGYFSYEEEGRQAVLATAKDRARAEAVRSGADPDTVRIVDIEEVPIGYMPGNVVRLRIKAVGALAGLATDVRPSLSAGVA
ncbi:hydantoinase/oxoprolinase family protein [Rhizorhabdus wittichii]|uniref:Hydantoinase/oxoprolinase family protein n=1 Tax=Rhizorhabdus wittichii TaxID=160791 RepID=A0A975HHK9_9SPHN|nr:hydantoinase/oxoprolinase family protein [Rhizorhabdus wittichii]QTH23984.1 hydantoinase/oxoprolinase family protein [Rhizorhabdus wittichii]